MCCNSPRKCKPVKYKKRQKAGFLIITYGSVCNSKQKWNNDECWCEHKELDDWSSCKDDYMWNPSTCDCDCNNLVVTINYGLL